MQSAITTFNYMYRLFLVNARAIEVSKTLFTENNYMMHFLELHENKDNRYIQLNSIRQMNISYQIKNLIIM